MFDFQEELDVTESESLYRKYLVPPFTIFDSKLKEWKTGKKKWMKLGIEGEVGRSAPCIHANLSGKDLKKDANYTSIFDPFLCEIIYSWFCPTGGSILDPFSGGSVRGIVASKLNMLYTGIDLRKEQIEANNLQGKRITPERIPNWIEGDSNKVLDCLEDNYFDFLFSCPPYFDLEVYSDSKEDLSNMPWDDFRNLYKNIIYKSCQKLKDNSFACFVVGDIRDENGFYRDLISLTKNYFSEAGARLYNEAILLNNISSASLRAGPNFRFRKLTKIHQNVLIFYKGDISAIRDKTFLI
jgi:hypothetical protein